MLRGTVDESTRPVQALAGYPPSAAGVWAAAVEVRLAGIEGELSQARRVAHDALGEARALGLQDVEADLLTSLAVAEGARGDPAEAIAHLEEVQRRAEQVDEPAAALRARYNLALALSVQNLQAHELAAWRHAGDLVESDPLIGDLAELVAVPGDRVDLL